MTENSAIDLVLSRKETHMEHGLSETIALGRACRELMPTKDLEKEIADEHDIEHQTLRTYVSKARSREEDLIKNFLTGIGGYREILAFSSSTYRDEWIAVLSAPGEFPDGLYAVPNDTIYLATIRTGGPSGEPTANLELSMETYPSLDALREDKYEDRGGSEYLCRWYSILVKAGYDEDELESPGEKLPDGHPDSNGFEMYQYTSQMPRER